MRNDEDGALEQGRKVAFQTAPQEVKRLALQYGLTLGQIRGLLLKWGHDRERFTAAAVKLRKE